MKIGFIGLGIMGSRMAANLQKHGYSLVVFNRTQAKAEPLLGPCGTFSESPAKLAEQVDVLFTMLAHPDAVEQAARGRSGFLDHLKPGSLWVDCSSVNPSFSKKMAAEAARHRVHFVDAPVTGSAPAAADAKLEFWVGADSADLETIRPLLLSMGNKIVHTGGNGSGTSMKMVVNLILGNAMAAFAEGMALGQGLGLSPKMLFDSLLGTAAAAPFLALKRAKIEKRDYKVEFPLRWMQKDMHLATVSGYETEVALPLTNVAKEIYRLAMRDELGTDDFSAVYEFLTNKGYAEPRDDHERARSDTTPQPNPSRVRKTSLMRSTP